MIHKVTVMASYDKSFEAIEHMDHYPYAALTGTYDCNCPVGCLEKSCRRRYLTLKNGASPATPLEIAVLC
jgi:hypothetical protein